MLKRQSNQIWVEDKDSQQSRSMHASPRINNKDGSMVNNALLQAFNIESKVVEGLSNHQIDHKKLSP